MDPPIPGGELLDTTSTLFSSNILSLLTISLLPVQSVEAGIFSRITMTSMTSKWYLRLSHFEAILVGLIVLQVFVMRYFLILPLDVTKLIDNGTLLATSVSRKRRAIDKRKIVQEQRLAESMFAIIRRLDEEDCFLRTLCELEVEANQITQNKSDKLSRLLISLKRLGLQRIKLESQTPANNVTVVERKVLAEFEDAVLLGSGYSMDNNIVCSDAVHKDSRKKDVCVLHFSLCTANKNDLLAYVENAFPFLP